MLNFSVEVDGIVEMDRGFNRVEQFISDFRSRWPEVARVFYRIESEQFASQGAAGASGLWAPLSKAYAAYKAVRFPNQPILRATNSLFDSMTRMDASDSIFRPTATDLTIGTQREGATAHQRGSGRMPARKIISLTDDSKRRLQKAIQIGLVQFVRRQGFTVLENAA